MERERELEQKMCNLLAMSPTLCLPVAYLIVHSSVGFFIGVRLGRVRGHSRAKLGSHAALRAFQVAATWERGATSYGGAPAPVENVRPLNLQIMSRPYVCP